MNKISNAIPVIVGPMKYLPTAKGLTKIVQYVGYNWFLCAQHVKAIIKITQVADDAFKKGVIWNKTYHTVMAVLQVVPLFGHIVAAVEVLSQSVRVGTSVNNNNDKTYYIEPHIDRSQSPPFPHQWLPKLYADPNEAKNVPSELWDHPIFAFELLGVDGRFLEYFNRDIKKNKCIAFCAVKGNRKAFEHVDPSLKKDEAFLLACIEKHGDLFFKEYVPQELKEDYVFCLKAAARHGSIYTSLNPEFQSFEQLILAAFSSFTTVRDEQITRDVATIFHQLPEAVKYDPKFCLEILKRNGLALQYMPKNIQASEKHALAAIKNHHEAYQWISEDLKKNNKFFKAAFSLNNHIFKYATDESITKNKEIVLDLIHYFYFNNNLEAFNNIHEDLKKDPEVINAAIGQTALIFPYLSEAQRDDLTIVLKALSSPCAVRIAEHISPRLRADFTVMCKVAESGASAMKYALGDLKSNEDFVMRAVGFYPSDLSLADDVLKNDLSFSIKLISQHNRPKELIKHIHPDHQNDPTFLEAFKKRLKDVGEE